MPENQQEAVRACFAAAKTQNVKGNRYSINWIYECLLIRIKSKKVYEHLRTKNILALPCVDTLQKYIQKMSSQYGFQQATFDILKKKSSSMKPDEKRGTLLLDEMKLSESVSFNKKTFEINGLTNLGDYTPEHQTNKKGDHALVLMFQPFRGKWVHSLACFLSKGCASSTVLHKIIIEAILLLEKSGFNVDVVTTDGATWNRSMWSKFGISKENISCVHMHDESRRLWFISDFPHLIKNMRNCLVKQEEFWTPDGVIKLKHWDAVIASENQTGYNLKICPGLCVDDVHPKPYQKMNVGRAYRFFGEKTAVAMEVYKESNIDLSDCEPTVTFIRRISNLIKAMDSRTSNNALHDNSFEYQAIKDFQKYLENWNNVAREKGYYFLTDSTYYGLQISLRATLEVFDYLLLKCDYKFLMTSRLNQDNLERFFSMMRSSCGSNDHPDSVLFMQIFRLISTYSLVKPPKGSNISGGEILSSLFSIHDLNTPDNKRLQFQQSIDYIVENGCDDPDMSSLNVQIEHNYATPIIGNISVTSDPVLAYISGYVARKASRFTKCPNCLDSLMTSQTLSRDILIEGISHGHLLKPSTNLFNLIKSLESATLKVMATEELSSDTIFKVIDTFGEVGSAQLVGCSNMQHKHGLTSAIINFFLVTRMHFICSRNNSIENSKKEKNQTSSKVS